MRMAGGKRCPGSDGNPTYHSYLRAPLAAEFSYNVSGEVRVADDPNSTNTEKKQVLENPELEEFFHRLPSNFRWPKPSDEAIAAAVEAIQRMAGGIAGAALTQDSAGDDGSACSGCGS